MDLLEEFISGIWGKNSQPRPNWVQWTHRNISDNHCSVCLKLDRCWFLKEKAPPCPHHPYCHCLLKPISYTEVKDKATAISNYSKYDPYLFNTEGKYTHTKEKLFQEWGYTVADAKWLKKEIEKQGLNMYILGNYELGLLNEHGQHINIKISIPRKDKRVRESVTFTSGWMVLENGTIKLNTPYGGK